MSEQKKKIVISVVEAHNSVRVPAGIVIANPVLQPLLKDASKKDLVNATKTWLHISFPMVYDFLDMLEHLGYELQIEGVLPSRYEAQNMPWDKKPPRSFKYADTTLGGFFPGEIVFDEDGFAYGVGEADYNSRSGVINLKAKQIEGVQA